MLCGGWKSIAKGWNIIELGAIWKIRDGSRLNFQADWWVGEQPFGLETEIDIPKIHVDAKVHDFILEDCSLDIAAWQSLLPEEKVDLIYTIPIPVHEGSIDNLFWARSTFSKFTVKSAYKLIAGHQVGEEDYN